MESFKQFLEKYDEDTEEGELLKESQEVVSESWLTRVLGDIFYRLKSPFAKLSRAVFRLLYRKKLTARNLSKVIKKFSRGKPDAIVEFRKIDFLDQYTIGMYIGGEFCMACVDYDFFVSMKQKHKKENKPKKEKLPHYRKVGKHRKTMGGF